MVQLKSVFDCGCVTPWPLIGRVRNNGHRRSRVAHAANSSRMIAQIPSALRTPMFSMTAPLFQDMTNPIRGGETVMLSGGGVFQAWIVVICNIVSKDIT